MVMRHNIPNIVIGLVLVIIGILSMNSGNIVLVATLSIAISAYNFFLSRKSIFKMVIFGFILYSNYSICLAQYINPISGVYTTLVNTEAGRISICILLIFNALLLVFGAVKSSDVDYSEEFMARENGNIIIAVGALLLVAVFYVFGIKESVIQGGRGELSAYYEYAIIILLMGFLYSGGRKSIQILLVCMAVLYCIKDFLNGGRITSLQMVIMVYLVFFHEKKIKFTVIVPLGLAGLVLLTAVGQLRGSFDFSLSSMINAMSSLVDGGFAMDTAYAAFYASQIFVLAALQDPFGLRISKFGAFSSSLFMGGNAESNLSVYTSSQVMWHGGGGLIPYYMYYYLGIIGVIFIAIYIAKLIGKICWNQSKLSKVLLVYITYSVPRWYLYSPVSIIRGLVLCIICYAICDFFDKSVKRIRWSKID